MTTQDALGKSEAGEGRSLAGRLRRQSRARWFPGAGLMAVAFGLLVLGAILMAANQARLRDNIHRVDHTQSVLRAAGDLDIALVDVESSARAYVLTGDAGYLADFHGARQVVDTAIAALTSLVADNPGQVARLEALRPILAQRMQRFDTAIAADPAERSALFTPERIQAGQALRKQVRAGLDAFRADEIALLGERQRNADRAAGRAVWLVAAIVVLSGLIAGLGLFLLQRERGQQRIRELQVELQHLSRLTTMGQTASMLAHEINQPLSAANNYLEATRRVLENEDSPKSAKAAEMLKKAGAQVHRAGEIVGRLRRYIGRQETGRAAESVETLVADTVSLLGALGDAARLRTEVAPGLPAILADRVQIQQVLVNLARNAIEAMAGLQRRDLAIIAAADGQAVRFSVADTGPGLPEIVTKQLFKPFVSTKPDGMGVGLSICRAILLDHGGRIWAEANPGGGTVFHFIVPVAAKPAS
ncbi:MAG TPA: CHASE3 domain-containing protein [Dongiaceae bacterium]|nr:CHASE3 domain-containing protein [Dongiaceae bacterium]